MTLFIPDVATGRLFLVILIFFPVRSSLQKPKISVSHNEKDVTISCEIPGSAGNDTTCNLYVGDQSQHLQNKTIWKKKSSSNLWFCLFTLTEEDQIRHLQSVGSQEVSCDYRVSSGPNSLSPRSDGYNITTGSTVSTVSPVSTHKAPLRPTSNLLTNATLIPKTPLRPTTSSTSSLTTTATTSASTSPLTHSTAVNLTSDLLTNAALIPKTPLRPTTSSTTSLTSMATSSGLTVSSTLTTDSPQSSTERGQSSTENVVKPKKEINLAVGLASGVGVFLVGLTAVCLNRKTKRNKSQSPQAQQDDYNEQFVMETNRCGSLVDSGHDGFYSVIPSVPFTFLPSGPVGENGQSSEHDNEYCTIPDRPAVSAQIDGLYSLLQTQ